MNVAPFGRPIRFALLGAPDLEIHFPSRCPWSTARFVAVEPGRWATAVDETLAFAADVVIVAEPHEIPPAELARLPGIKLGMVARPGPSSDDVARLAASSSEPRGNARFDFFTWFEEPPAEAADLPVLQILPLPVDTERCLAEPRLDLRRVLVPAWSRPPSGCLARLRRNAQVTEIPLAAAPSSWAELLAEGGTLVYWSRATLGRIDPLPLLALANGLLVVANTGFPRSWAVEQEDEYLVRESEDALALAVEESLRIPDSMRAVRVRAWQKVREAFSADGAFHRLVHDALLFARLGAAGTPVVDEARGAAPGVFDGTAPLRRERRPA